MKLLLALQISAVLAQGSLTLDNETIAYLDNFYQIVALLTGTARCPIIATNGTLVDSKVLKIYLYTLATKYSPEEFTPSNPEAVLTSKFDPSLPTFILIHGWLGSNVAESVSNVKDGYLETTLANVFICDYSFYSKDYAGSVARTKLFAQQYASFFNYMAQKQLVRPGNLHIVGHSLGAHISGFTADYLFDYFGEKVGRITGLDPAAPCFGSKDNVTEPDQRLSTDDGVFTDAVYSSQILGIEHAIVLANFFLNGGSNQPNCTGRPFPLDVICAHAQCYRAYRETILNRTMYPANICDSQASAMVSDAQKSTCVKSSEFMGEAAANNGFAIYNVPVWQQPKK